ncbi:hypothetical protein [Methylobrevis pamukkalensis]|uniref:Uncharacterized protein n=1 Tax=Methylobrevis pamukkalensis TaxID=1439726 RepID=A0A1E3H8F5_9HYPH|nr:hypothetical protein [Methylobrevis pamukkalensis]ODN72600.1 hypothetical protein A6302_00092 [Methylobrevis pamukkalensis]
MQRRHRRAHAAIWTGLAVVLPLAVAIIFTTLPKPAPDAPAVRLDAAPAAEGQP